MNANVVSGVGREEQGPLPEDLMSHTVTETVYLGRASFRITHELEAVGAEDTAPDSSEWFSRDAAVILKGGPNGLTARDKPLLGEEEHEIAPARPARGIPRAWLLIGLPVAAFGLGIAVASVAGSSAARHKTVTPAAVSTVTAPAPATRAAAPVALPLAEPIATPPALPAPAPAAALPPSTVALTPPVATAPAATPATVAAQPALAALPRVLHPAAKPRVAKKAKIAKTADPADAETTGDASPPEASTTPGTAAKKPAVKWVDPWAN